MKKFIPNFIIMAVIVISFSSVGFTQNKNRSKDNLRYLVPIFDKIDVEKDIFYSSQNTNLTLDLYYPDKDTATNRVAIILAHGGGYSSGDKTQLFSLAQALSKRGYVVICFNYRLNNQELRFEKTMRDVYEDTENTIIWLRQNSEKYGINTNFIALGGASAGGEIAHNLPDKSGLFAIISMYGSFSFPTFKLTRTPTILIHGDKDRTVPYETSVNFAKLLTDNGIFNELYTLKDMDHGVFEGSGIGEKDDYFYSSVSHISMFLYKCMYNYTNPVFKPEDIEINGFSDETMVLNLHRDKKEISNSGVIHLNLEKNWKIIGDTKFTAGQGSIQIPIQIPAYKGKTNIYLFYQSEYLETENISPSMVLIKIKDPVAVKINHPEITLQLDNLSKNEITNSKVLIISTDNTNTINFSLSPGQIWTSPIPENISGKVKVQVVLQNGWVIDYKDYIAARN